MCAKSSELPSILKLMYLAYHILPQICTESALALQPIQDRFSENLKRKSIDFITRNVQAVTHSPGWKDIVCEQNIMTEVVRAMGPR